MTWWQAILLGAVQGITEFLPVSSSGHLVLAQHFFGWSESKNASHIFVDGMLHWGTLVSVLLYFRKGLGDPSDTSSSDPAKEQAWPTTRSDLFRLVWLVLLASLPAVVVTLALDKKITASFHNPRMVAVDFLILGAILFFTDRLPPGPTRAPQTRWWQALGVGCGQALAAMFRGLSRSGMTIAAGLGLGLERGWAVRFSFLMSIVASLGLGAKGIMDAVRDPEVSTWMTAEFLVQTALGMAVAAIVGYFSIELLVRLVRRARLWWFAVYVWIIAVVVLSSTFWKPLG